VTRGVPEIGTSRRQISVGASTRTPSGTRGAKSNSSKRPPAVSISVRSTLVLRT
jgi:hypothetical protein